MNREFFINIVFLLALNLIIKPFYIFGIDLTIQNRVGAAEYGLYATLFDFTFLFYIINDIGLQQFNSRSISQHNFLIKKHLPKLLLLKTGLSIFYLITVFSVAVIIYPSHYYPLIFYVSINHILISLVFFLRTNISGMGMYRLDSVLSAMDKLLLILVCAVLLWGNLWGATFQIEWFIWAQTLTWTITAITAASILKFKVSRLDFFLGKKQLTKIGLFWWAILKRSYPFALVFLLMTVYTRIDKVMIERLLPNGQVEAGIYAAGYRLLDASNMLGFLFAGLLLPMFSRMLKEKKGVQPLVDMSFQMIMAGAITVAVSCWFYQSEIMFLLIEEASHYYGTVMSFLMLSFIAVCGIYIYSTLLTANASLKKMNWLFVISIIINVCLNVLLIEQERALGAAKATLITQFFVMIGTMWLSKSEIGISIKPAILWKVIGFGLTFSCLVYSIYHSMCIEAVFVKFFVGLLMGILLSFVFKLINIQMLIELFADRQQNE